MKSDPLSLPAIKPPQTTITSLWPKETRILGHDTKATCTIQVTEVLFFNAAAWNTLNFVRCVWLIQSVTNTQSYFNKSWLWIVFVMSFFEMCFCQEGIYKKKTKIILQKREKNIKKAWELYISWSTDVVSLLSLDLSRSRYDNVCELFKGKVLPLVPQGRCQFFPSHIYPYLCPSKTERFLCPLILPFMFLLQATSRNLQS